MMIFLMWFMVWLFDVIIEKVFMLCRMFLVVIVLWWMCDLVKVMFLGIDLFRW